MARVTDHLTVAFGDKSDGVAPIIVIEESPTQRIDGWDFMLRVYAGSRRPTIRASEGEVGIIRRDVRQVEGEAVVIQGNDTVPLHYPPSGGVSLRRSGTMFDASGNSINPSMHYDTGLQAVRFGRPGYGVVFANYNAEYTLVGYRYARSTTIIGNYGGHAIPLTRWVPGSVYAFLRGEPPSVASFQIPEYEYTVERPPEPRIELWRQVSYVQITKDGSYERHAGYPTETFVPAGYRDYILDGERTHVIAYMNRSGSVYEVAYGVPLELPFSSGGGGGGTYPIKSYKYANITSPDQTWGDANAMRSALSYIDSRKRRY